LKIYNIYKVNSGRKARKRLEKHFVPILGEIKKSSLATRNRIWAPQSASVSVPNEYSIDAESNRRPKPAESAINGHLKDVTVRSIEPTRKIRNSIRRRVGTENLGELRALQKNFGMG